MSLWVDDREINMEDGAGTIWNGNFRPAKTKKKDREEGGMWRGRGEFCAFRP